MNVDRDLTLTGRSALVLSGGGARGAYQVGVLKALTATVPSGRQPFDIVTGVSVGALNAAVLGMEPLSFPAGVERLERVWRGLQSLDVYDVGAGAVRGRMLSWAQALLFGWAGATPPPSLLDNAPLEQLLAREVDFAKLNAGLGRPDGIAAMAITASSYATGRAVTFFNGPTDLKPWERARRAGIRGNLTADHILASSALPLVFPARAVDGRFFGDGALRESAPLSAAIHLGADRILTIGARDLVPDPEEARPMTYPTVGYLAGQLLDILFNDDAEADLERARRINATLEEMMPETRKRLDLRPLDIVSINPSHDIRPIAGLHIDELPGPPRMILKAIGALNPPYVVPSYLMFEPSYIGALIDLGERDGLARFADDPLGLGARFDQ